MTDGIVLYFGAWLMVGAQKIEASLKVQSDESPKRKNHVFYIVHVGVGPKEKREIGLSEKSGTGFDMKGEEGERSSKGLINEHIMCSALWEAAQTCTKKNPSREGHRHPSPRCPNQNCDP